MLSIQLPRDCVVDMFLEVGKTYDICKESGEYITVWGHLTMKDFDNFEVIRIGKYSVDFVFRTVQEPVKVVQTTITRLFVAKYLENTFDNAA